MKKLFTFLSITLFTFIIFSCGSTKAGSNLDVLTAGNWELETFKGKAAAEAGFSNKLPVANFSIDLKISGNNGCNGYRGSYNLNEDGGINISQMVSTRMFCPGGGEKLYMDALNSVNAARVDKDKLVLFKDAEEVLVFKHISK
ncbi:META domain-containing protein [Flavobacterium sp. RHBU_3]|uniref:META domain-containing protein n=1 Tax=Flavobacterium sp. RHBU_3 TaxID=3391184 RepID=UPI003984828C